jgi:hypothetical protein
MTGLKNKTWTNQPIKNNKKEPCTQTHQTTETTENCGTHILFLNTSNTIYEKNCESLCVQVNLKTRKINAVNINAVFSQCGS